MWKFLLAMLLSLVAVAGTLAFESRRFPRLPNVPVSQVAFSIGTCRRMVLGSPYFWLALLLIWGGAYAGSRW